MRQQALQCHLGQQLMHSSTRSVAPPQVAAAAAAANTTTSDYPLRDVYKRQALLGPSGAGKSTLMDILAQRKSTGNLSGFLLANGRPTTSSFIRKTAYVPQVSNTVCGAASLQLRLQLHSIYVMCAFHAACSAQNSAFVAGHACRKQLQSSALAFCWTLGSYMHWCVKGVTHSLLPLLQ